MSSTGFSTILVSRAARPGRSSDLTAIRKASLSWAVISVVSCTDKIEAAPLDAWKEQSGRVEVPDTLMARVKVVDFCSNSNAARSYRPDRSPR
jgi:hypothetical protein